MKWMQKVLAVGGLLLGFAMLATVPAYGQENIYVGGNTPTVGGGSGGGGGIAPTGGVSAAGGGTPAVGVGGPVGDVRPATGERAPQVVPTQVLASQASGAVAATRQAPVQRLALTGADIVTLVAVGLSMTAVGIFLTRRGRARSLLQA